MKELTIGKNDSGQRLDRFLDKAIPHLPASLCQKYIRLKRIKINGKSSKREYRLNEGDILSMYINDEFFDSPKKQSAYLKITNPKLDIIYEDDNIMLVNKQPGVLVHSDDDCFQNTLIASIQAYLYQKGSWKPVDENSFTPALCNRIDRNTGGIVIAAKNASALRIMNEKIKNHEVDKYYLCIVHGEPSPRSGMLKGYIFKDSVQNRVYVSQQSEKGSKTAATEYQTLASTGSLSLLECRLLTGRTHQIRAQLASAGYPLLGDGKYGTEKDNERFQALYSYKIAFSFISYSGDLNYLKNKVFTVPRIEFVEKYFDSSILH